MTDRELLEAAARAAGIEHPGGNHSIHDDGRLWDCKRLAWWNPLLDDGDAFRLAVRLRIDVVHPNPADLGGGYVTTRFRKPKYVELPIKETSFTEDCGSDPLAATRRAIVRAAAAMGGSDD